ncbi:ATP-dependent DNA helicase DinG [Sporosarcina sp. JAI121]|uniref:ATP-dependent DNA helicase DinG n=1 Tax=Sporosarcina sp. JAI121 TaxID=2723064 RepID=UPI0015C7A305|nr:ATP-dependent DNA helicase DinG [Sporosarcina sp. JAI121]NYF24528.1 ATP-dependent DNA helicase DinG [Sporosarcina sp. JAI121]
MHNKTYAVVDLETTGHSPAKGDRMIQIAIVFIKNGEIADKYVSFVNPGQKIPAFIRQLTAISDEDVKDAPSFEEIAIEVATLLEGTVFIAHNTDFDLSFLQSEFARCGIPRWTGKKIDTVELSKILIPSAPSYRLQDITEELGIPLASAHRADDDAEATAKLFLMCMQKLHTLPEDSLNLLHRRSFRLKTDLATLFYEALKIARTKSVGKEFLSFRGIPYRNRSISDTEQSESPVYPFDNHEKIAQLEKAYPEFEQRESQFEFMDAVWDALSTQTEIIAEVPTGIGKTVAYLLPAAIRSIETGKPVVISTYTNHLADKIMDEELEKVRLILGFNVTATVLKGREQYISLGKFEELLRIADESYDETFTIMQILVWLTETVTGDLEELNISGGGQLFLDRIRKRSNKLAPDEQAADYHYKLLEACGHSNLIITNHSMLLSDLNRREGIFSLLGGLVVDEAHQFVQAASMMNETVFSYTNWKYVMGQIASEASGHLLQKVDALNSRLRTDGFHNKEQLDSAFIKFLTLFDHAIATLTAFNPPKRKKQQGNRQIYTLAELDYKSAHFSKVVEAMSDYISKAEAFADGLSNHFDNLTKNEQAIVADWNYWVREMTIKAGEWVEVFLEDNTEDFTVWMEKDMRSIPGSLTVIKRSLDGSQMIRKFIDKLKGERTGIIWTSGTLRIPENERFISRQLGIDDSIPLLLFDAPAHFYEGAEVIIVEDMPDIQQVSQSDYILAVTDAVIQTVMATGGRLFVLFTSQDMLRKTYDIIMESEQLEDYALFAQGISSGSRLRLLKSFRQFNNSVLFGTNSFWEGVDVPGDALSAVIAVRLPFSSPEEPMYKAKAAKLSAAGLNPFTEHALPEAVMRLRQGFGRLIRSSTDKGFFIILDRRIETKSYGKRFLEAFPDVPVKKVSLEHMVNELENCYNE